MHYIFDTSSLLALTRYFIPFDNNEKLKLLFKQLINKDIIIIDKVIEESRFVSKGAILKSLNYLTDKNHSTSTSNIVPTGDFIAKLETDFCYDIQRKKLKLPEFETIKNNFLKTADPWLIMYCIEHNKQLYQNIIVTEETKTNNDKKLFKKIPSICQSLNIQTCSLTDYFKDHLKIQLSNYLK